MNQENKDQSASIYVGPAKNPLLEPTHPIWSIIRQLCTGIVLIAGMKFFYHDPLMWKDFAVVFGGAAAQALVDHAQRKQAKNNEAL